MVVCVLDAGPLIHLDQLGTLQLLADMGMIFCPKIVLEEAEKYRPGIGFRLDFIYLVEASNPRPIGLKSVAELHAGELAALAWAEEYGADIFLSDDTGAREAAGEMKIQVCGTVGIILRAARNGHAELRNKVACPLFTRARPAARRPPPRRAGAEPRTTPA